MTGALTFPTKTGTAVFSAVLVFVLSCLCSAARTTVLPFFGSVEVVDEVDCTKSDHRFEEFPLQSSKVATVAGRQCRFLPVQDDSPSLLKWRLGEGKGVVPGGAYVVAFEYPDDAPRDYIVRNNGNNSRRSFHTGAAIGDAWEAKYVDHKPESLKIPQSGKWETWAALTFPGEKAAEREEIRKGADGKDVPLLTNVATEGFDFILAQYGRKNHPESQGLAVSKILLCKIPDEKALWADIAFPFDPLPRRRIFWREEMSDGAMDKLCPGNAGLDWIEQKFRTMKIFGQNVYCKDLLEFGHNQHWDCNWNKGASGAKPANWMWGTNGQLRDLWTRAVPKAVKDYGLELLPYYEYGGAAGDKAVALGPQKRSEPLNLDNKPDKGQRGANYTHIWWSEGKLRVDITDPDTLAEFKYILDGTILRFRDEVSKKGFAGAWLRPRPGQWAVSFADATRRRFADEKNGGVAVSRADLSGDRSLYDRYIEWFGEKRAAFMDAIRAYLEENGVKNAIAILDNEDSEAGPGLFGRNGIVTDDRKSWERIVGSDKVIDISDKSIVERHLYLNGLKTPTPTWGPWEWQHACPADDPEHYKAFSRTWLAMPFHRLFSVNDPAAFDAYRNSSGTDTIVRHYGLNENMIEVDGKKPMGYAIADFERAGRACMMAEVNAMANGDPVNLGYLMGSNYTRGFPGPVQEFNRNFLALPALRSEVIPGACQDKDVVVRKIDCSKPWGLGVYYYIVHVGWTPKPSVRISLPSSVRVVTDIDGVDKRLLNGEGTFSLQPWQLLTLWSPQ